jgi:hypothetical protein
MAKQLCKRPAAKGERRVRSTRPPSHSGASGAQRQRAAAAPKCKSSRVRELDKLRQNRSDKRRRGKRGVAEQELQGSSSEGRRDAGAEWVVVIVRDAVTQTEPCNLSVVAEQELQVVQGLARLLATTPLYEEVQTCGERLALALALHDGDPGAEAAAAQFALSALAGPGAAR